MVHRCRAALRSRRGETLVEVLTAFALLLLFLSGFAASLHTAAALQQRAADTRAAADACIAALRPPSGAPPAVPDGSAAYVFRGPDMTQGGPVQRGPALGFGGGINHFPWTFLPTNSAGHR